MQWKHLSISYSLPQKSQLARQIVTLQQTGFLNKYPQCIGLILNSRAVCLGCIPTPRSQCKSVRSLTLFVLSGSQRPEKHGKSDICPLEQTPTNKPKPLTLLFIHFNCLKNAVGVGWDKTENEMIQLNILLWSICSKKIFSYVWIWHCFRWTVTSHIIYW